MRTPNEIADLLFRRLRDELTPEEEIELNSWRAESSENELLYGKLTDPEKVREMVNDLYSYKERAWQKILNQAPELRPAAKIKKFRWRNLSVAAAILILLGTVIFGDLLINWRQQVPATGIGKSESLVNDIPPGSDKAVLTLANGEKVVLDKMNTRAISRLSGNNVALIDSTSLHYLQSGTKTEASENYNSLSTPRGGQFHLVLSDGTNVWLNAASSISYPIAFRGQERKVEIQGEVYFEVAKNAKMPFIVKVRNTEIRVIGTHFNVNSYKDENSMIVTLLEGSIRIVNGGENKMIQPGEQAMLSNSTESGRIEILDHIDADKAIAWKNGVTFFKNADIPTIMRMISRWYDIDVVFEGEIPKRSITGGVSRGAKLSEILKVLQLNKIHFSAEGNKIIVRP